jgi:hypothetical protein
MPVGPSLAQTPAGREIGSLALSCLRVEEPMAILRAAQWRNALARLGLGLPLFAVHDLGLLLVLDPRQAAIGLRPHAQTPQYAAVAPLLEAWAATLREIATSEIVERARAWRLSDDLVAVLLVRLLGSAWERHLGPGRRPQAPALPLDPEVYRDLEPQLPGLFGAGREPDLRFLQFLGGERLRLVTAVERVDLDTLRLLGMFGAEAGAMSALSMLDLLQVFESAGANDVVNFSLDLLPSVLETKKASGQQTFSVDGYSGVDRRGSIDSLVLSELAFDPELFLRRFAENEVFYYAREKQHEQERTLHYVCIDASASMRGRRSTFARGLALALVKKLTLRGEEVWLRYFDSRLYEPQHARPGRAGDAGINVPYVLCFQGERGRNYARVFAQLADEVGRLARRERRSPVVYILTHGECHVPVDTIERLRAVARLYGVFLLPSTGRLDLEYLSRLHTVQVVDEAALLDRDARAARALDILDAATGDRPGEAPAPGRGSAQRRGGAGTSEGRGSREPGRRSLPPSRGGALAGDRDG